MGNTRESSDQKKSLTGTRLGKYQVGTEIGQGGMGTVYKGYDPTLDRFVALKVMAPHLTWEEGFVERFLREARAAGRLRHPSIVTVHDVGRDRGWYYFAMDFVEGETLAQLIKDRGPMSIEDALPIIRPLAGALDHAHKQGLIHRDIKPSNVVVDDTGHVTLMDFGIARASQATRLTRSGAVIGTPEYMAPEQASGGEVGPGTDQYALAVVTYELLVGNAPFRAKSTPTLLYKIVHESPPPLSAARPDLPAKATDVLARALSKERENRYPTCSAFVGALERAEQLAPARARATRSAIQTERQGRTKKARRRLLGLGGAGLLIIGLLCMLVAVVGVVVGLLALGGMEAVSGDAAATASARQALATASAYLPATTPSVPSSGLSLTDTPIPSIEPTAAEQDAVLFEEDFENPWDGWEIGDYEGGSLRTDSGVYVVTSAGELQWMWGVANLFFTDVAIEVEATQVQAGPDDDNDYGIGCRMQPNGDGYHMIVSGDGFYAIYLREDGSFIPLVEFQQSDAIRQGDATNRIRAECSGSTLSLSVNGQYLAAADDITFEGGDLALMATSYEDSPTEIHFDNLVVYDAAD